MRAVGRPLRRLVSGGPPWRRARALLEEARGDEAHALLAEAIGAELREGAAAGTGWGLPLLTLELGKSFLKQTEAQDALDAFEHSVGLFEEAFFNRLPEDADEAVHARYVESLLHLAKLLSLAGQGDPEHHWKKAISHAMKHLGRDSYEIVVASLGVAEHALEQLRLPEAERYAAAAAEAAAALPPSPAARARRIEAIALLGVACAQRQDTEQAIEHYSEALALLDEGSKGSDEGMLDSWTRAALHNLYRNMEHAHRARGDDEAAQAWKKRRDARLTELRDVVLEEQPTVRGKV